MNLSFTAPTNDSFNAVSSSTILGTIIPGESIRNANGSQHTRKPVSDFVVHT